MIRRTLPKRVLAVLALLCLSVASVSAQVHIREKIQIQPTSPPIPQAEVNTSDNLRFVFEWTPERIVGRMFVTGLDNDFNVVVDTFLTDVGGHLEVISPAVEGEYTFNLQIRTAELLPGEQETLKLSIYLNETLVREATDFSYSFCDVFCVWIPESFIFFADPLHHFSLQLATNQPSYGEATVLTVTARDAGNSEITLDGSKTLTLRVVSEDFFSFITASGDTVGPEMTRVPYSLARAGTISLIANGLVPDTFSVSGIVSAELEENTSKTGQLEFEADMPCVQTNLSSTTAQPGDTVTVSFLYTRTDGSPGYFRPDQQFSVFIADNDSMGLLYSSDGQIGPDLFGAIQPLYYVAPDSLLGDSLVVQFLVAPVSAGGAAAAVPVGSPWMNKKGSAVRSSSNAFQMLALSECTVAEVIVSQMQGVTLRISTVQSEASPISPNTDAGSFINVIVEATLPDNIPVQGVAVHLTAKGIEGTGGHDHIGNRPPGSFIVANGITVSNGRYATLYRASAFAGVERLFVESPDALNKDSVDLPVRYQGLVLLGTNSLYDKIGGTAKHTGPPPSSAIDNDHWGKPQVIDWLVKIAATYWNQLKPTNKIKYNDISLPQGGGFDIKGGWKVDIQSSKIGHILHRIGTAVDIRTNPPNGDGIPINRRVDFEKIVQRYNKKATVAIHPPNESDSANKHFHVDFDLN